MGHKFTGNTRGIIRGIKHHIQMLQAADARQKDNAEARGKIPILFASTPSIAAALTNLLNRCNDALAAV